MKLIYIAGPYSAETAWLKKQNIQAAEKAAETVWMLGHAALCPHLNTQYMDGIATYDQFIEGSLLMVERCDAVLLIDGWQRSTGAKIEKKHAEKHGVPVFIGLKALKKFLGTAHAR